VEVARKCLKRDPRQRWTLAQISAHLQLRLPAPAKPVAEQRQATGRPQKPAAQRRYLIPALAAGATLAALVIGVSLFNRPPDQRAPAAALDEPAPQRPTASTAPRTPSQTQPVPRAALRTASGAAGAAAPASSRPRENAAAAAFVPGQVVQQVLPDVPQSASNTIRGTVRVTVRVLVNAAGEVSGDEMVSAGPSRYFARLASEAARRWKFSPARRDGRSVPSAWLLRFEFTRGGTRAIPESES
jgi:TonB family protein